jgi:hypothetical protein
MKRINIILLFLFSIAIIFLNCKKDPDTKTEKLVLYFLLCPNGLNACYNDCADRTGLSDGQVTGEDYNNFNSCKSQCDVYCNTSFLFIQD